MSRGFFRGSLLSASKPPISLVPKCGACGLYKHCKTPKMGFSGRGRKKILIIGDAPRKEEDSQKEHFRGRDGKFLEKILRKYGINLRTDCWLTNALICRNKRDAAPDKNQIDWCRPNLISTIKDLQPEIIIPLGEAAVLSLMGYVWKTQSTNEIGSLAQWVGWQIPCQKLNAWIFPTYHPRDVVERDREPVLQLFFERHIQAAAQKKGRPYTTIPDYKSQIEIILDTDKAAKIIDKFIKRGGYVAFDYEGTALKPEVEGAWLVSAAVCWNGKRTIAFLLKGATIDAMRRLCEAKSLKKIASNMKFEHRWSKFPWRKKWGWNVVNWYWDTMLAAHLIDCRPNITGLKFQAFVLLGCDSYDDHIKEYLKTKKGKKTNQILQEVDTQKLLLYNGMDSLLEYLVMVEQRRILGYDPAIS